MAIAASGAVSFSDLRTEYVSGSGAVSYSDLYRGGSNIRAKAGDNSATNLAANVPTSGVITLANFRGTAKGFKYTFNTGATNQNAASLFGDDIDVNYPKVIEILTGVTLGGVGGTPAFTVPSTLAGSLTITNAGSIIGTGGSANGGSGGNAISCSASNVTINNTGTIAGGGGGGGQGGTGGNGSYSSTSTLSPNSTNKWIAASQDYSEPRYLIIRVNGSNVVSTYVGTSVINQTTYGNYSRGSLINIQYNQDNEKPSYNYNLQQTTTQSTSGGSGGSGGVGQGYNQSNASGSGGASGGTNAGTGGTGGSGGTYGNSGSTGATGANGNASNGSSGSGGGSAGAAVAGTSVTMNNTGNLYGAVA
jgi:hypothetical protein